LSELQADALNELDELDELNELLLVFFDVDYLPAFVAAGLGVDPVRHLRLARIFVSVELRHFQRIVRPTRPRARFGMSSFWIWHSLVNRKS
jgi:hypothetical protein